MRNKLKVGQQIMCGMSRSWGKQIIVALGLTHALVGCYANRHDYYEHNVSYFEIKVFNQHLFKGEN